MVTAQLAGQVADIAALSGRAKDLIGVATISTTITGGLANDRLVNVGKHDINPFALGFLIVGFCSVLIAGFFVLKPRSWSLVPNADEIKTNAVAAHPTWPIDAYYGQVAMGFLTPGLVVPGKTAIQQNAENIDLIRNCIYVQLVGLGLLAIAGFILASQAL